MQSGSMFFFIKAKSFPFFFPFSNTFIAISAQYVTLRYCHSKTLPRHYDDKEQRHKFHIIHWCYPVRTHNTTFLGLNVKGEINETRNRIRLNRLTLHTTPSVLCGGDYYRIKWKTNNETQIKTGKFNWIFSRYLVGVSSVPSSLNFRWKSFLLFVFFLHLVWPCHLYMLQSVYSFTDLMCSSWMGYENEKRKKKKKIGECCRDMHHFEMSCFSFLSVDSFFSIFIFVFLTEMSQPTTVKCFCLCWVLRYFILLVWKSKIFFAPVWYQWVVIRWKERFGEDNKNCFSLFCFDFFFYR